MTSDQKRTVKGLSALLAALAAIQVAAGFASTAGLIVVLGAGSEADALIAGQTLPMLVVAIVGTALVNILVPLLTSLGRERPVPDIAWQLLAGTGLLFSLFTAALVALAPWWARILFPGFPGETAVLLVSLTRIQLVGMIFAGLAAVLTATCRIRGRFVHAELSQTVAALVNLGLIMILVPQHGVLVAAWLWTIRYALLVLMLLPVAGLPRAIRPEAALLRNIWNDIRPLLLGASIFKLTPLVDRYLASAAAPGGIALYSLAMQACSAGATVLERSLLVPAISQLNRDFTSDRFLQVRKAYRRNAIHCLLLVATAFSCLAGIRLLWGADIRSLPWAQSVDVDLLLWLLLLLAGSALGMTLGPMVVAVFYAMRDSLTPTRIGIAGFLASVPIKWLGFELYGIKGLAIASSVYYLLNLAAGHAVLRRRLAPLALPA